MTGLKRLCLSSAVCVAGLLTVGIAGQSQTPQPAPSAETAPRPPGPAIDLSGYWTPARHEDMRERGGSGAELGDWGGLALNEAGRLWALAYDPSRLTLRQHQCEGWVTPYQMRATGNFRIWEERDPYYHRLVAIHIWAQTFEGHRVIWMDGRPHPPAWAPHTLHGYSTGRFVGNALVVTTTHLKQGWLSRSGAIESDQATVTEFFIRHDDHLSNVTVISDPVYLSEPVVRSNDYARQPVDHEAWLYPCDDLEQVLDRAPDVVPHYLFGRHPFVGNYSEKYKLPLMATLAGAPSVYPEFADRVAKATAAEGLAMLRPAPNRPNDVSQAVDPEPRDGEIHTLPLRDNVYLLVGDGGNIVVQAGPQGAFVVDTGTGALADKVVAAIRQLTPKPIQFVANTSFHPEHVGGNEKIGAAGSDRSFVGSFFSGSIRSLVGVSTPLDQMATLIAHTNVQVRMQARNYRAEAIATDTYLEDRRRKFYNDEAVELFHQPHAVTDGDSLVYFRGADVIVAGDIFTTTQYPVIDVANGGTIQGEINALNAILNRTVFEHEGEGGTIVVPGHGYVSNEREVTEYRDMLVIIRDRVQAMLNSGATLAQVKAARLTADYDTRFGANSGPWTTENFVEAVFKTLKPVAAAKPATATRSARPARPATGAGGGVRPR